MSQPNALFIIVKIYIIYSFNFFYIYLKKFSFLLSKEIIDSKSSLQHTVTLISAYLRSFYLETRVHRTIL